MERIASFCVDHTKLEKGIYVSRVDGIYTTYDIRMCKPNVDIPLDPASAHTIEHIGATLLRNGKNKENILYFGPMGCMTGFYLISKELDIKEVTTMMLDVFKKISEWDKEIPGAKEEECGNYTFMDLEKAKKASEYFISSELKHTYHYLDE